MVPVAASRVSVVMVVVASVVVVVVVEGLSFVGGDIVKDETIRIFVLGTKLLVEEIPPLLPLLAVVVVVVSCFVVVAVSTPTTSSSLLDPSFPDILSYDRTVFGNNRVVEVVVADLEIGRNGNDKK